uniref:Uncharacterized protein n=1 Tax=Arundo donax TaxID=35708 RepID=A0A0A9GQK9_ARUDO
MNQCSKKNNSISHFIIKNKYQSSTIKCIILYDTKKYVTVILSS